MVFRCQCDFLAHTHCHSIMALSHGKLDVQNIKKRPRGAGPSRSVERFECACFPFAAAYGMLCGADNGLFALTLDSRCVFVGTRVWNKHVCVDFDCLTPVIIMISCFMQHTPALEDWPIYACTMCRKK